MCTSVYLLCCCMYIYALHSGPGIAEGDENCKKFLEKTMPDSFQKVMAETLCTLL